MLAEHFLHIKREFWTQTWRWAFPIDRKNCLFHFYFYFSKVLCVLNYRWDHCMPFFFFFLVLEEVPLALRVFEKWQCWWRRLWRSTEEIINPSPPCPLHSQGCSQTGRNEGISRWMRQKKDVMETNAVSCMVARAGLFCQHSRSDTGEANQKRTVEPVCPTLWTSKNKVLTVEFRRWHSLLSSKGS